METPQLDVQALYLEYVNNYLTVEKFAEHYGISFSLADMIISEGRDKHEFVASLKK